MKLAFSILSIISFSILLSSCEPEDIIFGKHVKGTGDIINKTRNFNAFVEIEVANNSDVEVYKSSTQTVEVSDYENIIKYTQASVEGNRLVIKTEPENINISNSKSKVIIHVPSLKVLHLSGSGNIILKDDFTEVAKVSISGSGNIENRKPCNFKDLNISISGSGDIQIKGTANNVATEISGSGDINLAELLSQNARCSISGSGNTTVSVNTNLDAQISGSGDIEYYGHPSVNSSISGSGSVTKAK